MKPYRNQLVAAAATLVAAAIIVVPALATPSSGGFGPVLHLSLGDFGPLDVKADKIDKWDLLLKTKDDTDIGVDKLTILAGGQSGWHTHAGPTFVTVTVGQIVWYDGANSLCPSTTYRVGDSFVEPANHVHLVRNASGATAEFIAIQIRPHDAPGRIDAPQPKSDKCPSF